MIISPPLLRERSDTETDGVWVDRMMPSDPQRGYPVSASHAWHGGIHITHSDSGSQPEFIRAIADGTVLSLRKPSLEKRDILPLNYNGPTDCGYILLKHETEIGSGDEGKVVYYSLYMHLKSISSTVSPGKTIYRKDPLGTVGMIDGRNAIHFQIFCDDNNIEKSIGRTAPELDLTKNGRTDIIYGDIHFYLPMGTPFYESLPNNNSLAVNGPVHNISSDLVVTMRFDKGSCTMVTRQKEVFGHGKYSEVGDPLVNADGADYEYNLYETALNLYPDSPSAGYELLRFGRVITTENETLSPADAPLWRTVNYPGGKGFVNLSARNVKVFSDGDFPHWMGWMLVDDDTDTNSQCNSPIVLCRNGEDLSGMICHFPLEWDKSTVDTRFKWLMQPNDVLNEPMAQCDLDLLTDHGKALCLLENPLPAGRVWHFEPKRFIEHFRKCNWLGENDLVRSVRRTIKNAKTLREEGSLSRTEIINRLTMLKNSSSKEVIRPAKIKDNLSKIIVSYGMDSPLRIAHFLSQIYCETGRINGVIENGDDNYFTKYESKKDSNGKEINNLAHVLGNTMVGDGLRFKGRGVVQLTGRKNYTIYGNYKGNAEKFLSNMGATLMSTTPYYCCDVGGFYWIQKQRMKITDEKLAPWGSLSIHYWADLGKTYEDVQAVTKCVNGGHNGLDDVRWPCFEHSYYIVNDDIEKPNNFKPIE